MGEAILTKLAEHGVLGLLLAASGFVIYKLYGALEESRKGRTSEVEAVQKARIDDQKAHNAQLVDMIRTCTAAIAGSSNAADSTKEALGEIRSLLEKALDRSLLRK